MAAVHELKQAVAGITKAMANQLSALSSHLTHIHSTASTGSQGASVTDADVQEMAGQLNDLRNRLEDETRNLVDNPPSPSPGPPGSTPNTPFTTLGATPNPFPSPTIFPPEYKSMEHPSPARTSLQNMPPTFPTEGAGAEPPPPPPVNTPAPDQSRPSKVAEPPAPGLESASIGPPAPSTAPQREPSKPPENRENAQLESHPQDQPANEQPPVTKVEPRPTSTEEKHA